MAGAAGVDAGVLVAERLAGVFALGGLDPVPEDECGDQEHSGRDEAPHDDAGDGRTELGA